MCPRRFANKGAVAPHERTHTGEKPCACSMCPVRFTNKNLVRRSPHPQVRPPPLHIHHAMLIQNRLDHCSRTPAVGGWGALNARATSSSQVLQAPPTGSGGKPRPGPGVLGVPMFSRAFHQQEPGCATRADPHGRKALHMLDVPPAVQPEGPGCAARADPHGREAVRLLDVPDAVRQQERRCPTRTDPHGREAACLLDVPKAG